ncbi:hypothetical protein JQK87_10960 [Streptomyces sp. G44]|uniref:hypothetical protein n=1 Tax=Streptomyces sp. G44 TaxID=2807632 RepID=UPI00196078DA|nr:hypothetical protein [Streptomyces sp. G44]MBM7168926.1 hypothetical protein [Streptomyces sp. G44]
MRVKPDSGKESKDQEEPEEKRRLDLSVPQVAGSAIAAVVAAKLASNLGVYGTILGAGVVSGIATCGGTIFQHFFKRTGEQIRVVAVQAKPKAHQVPATSAPRVPETFKTAARQGRPGAATTTGPVTTTWGRTQDAGADATTALPAADADPTTVLPSVATDLDAPLDAEKTQLLGSVDATRLVPREDATQLMPREDATRSTPRDDATRVLHVGAQAPPPGVPLEPPLPSDEFTDGTTHRARIRSWKRPLIAAAVVFGVAMGGITAYELVTDQDLSGGKGTTIGNSFTGNHSSPEKPSTPSGEPTGQPSDNGTSGTDDGSRQGGDNASQDPDGTGGQTPGKGNGSGTGSGSDSQQDPDKGTGTDPDTDKGTDSGDDGSTTDPTPTPKPTPTPSNGTGTGSGSGSGTDSDGGAQQGETTSP